MKAVPEITPICLLLLVLCMCAHARPALDTLRKAFAESNEAREKQNPTVQSNKEGGFIAWGESRWLDATLSMYDATRDVSYLRSFLDRGRQVLDFRDSVTHTKDYTGRCQPAWSSDGHYTIGKAAILDDQGREALVLETIAHSYNGNTTVTLRSGNAGGYTIKATNSKTQKTENWVLKPDLESIAAINRGSTLIRLYPKTWPESRATLRPLADVSPPTQNLVFSVHTGMIAAPLARFAAIVEKHELKEFAKDARIFAEAAHEAVMCHESEWFEEGDSGWYRFLPGAPYWMDGCTCPNNYSCAIGRAFVQLYRYDPKKLYRERIARIARGLKSDMRLESDGAYTWHYFAREMVTGWKPGEVKSRYLNGEQAHANAEDISHGAIDFQFACMAHGEGIVFDKADMDALAITFTKRILKADGKLSSRVDGIGTGEKPPPAWLSIVVYRPELADKLAPRFTELAWLELETVRR